ncbi:MAG: hypothetical protein AAF607_14055 [Pseudomonadota bacterium]
MAHKNSAFSKADGSTQGSALRASEIHTASGQTTWVQPDTSLDHVTALARQLVRHLGEAGARKTCQDNHWNGVLNAIDTIR